MSDRPQNPQNPEACVLPEWHAPTLIEFSLDDTRQGGKPFFFGETTFLGNIYGPPS